MQRIERLEQLIKCPVCSKLPENAMDCSWCHALICEQCIRTLLATGGVNAKCPKCFGPPNFCPSDAIRQLVVSAVFRCADCRLNVRHADRETHKRQCEHRLRKCAFCDFVAPSFSPSRLTTRLRRRTISTRTACRSIVVSTSSSAIVCTVPIRMVQSPSDSIMTPRIEYSSAVVGL